MKKPLAVHDLSLRDSIGDFVTLHLKSDELSEILALLDRIGYSSIDAFGGGSFMPTMTILGEDPWQRLRVIRQGVRHTPLQAVLRGRMLFGRWIAPSSTVRAVISHLRDAGVDRLKISDTGMDPIGSARVITMAKEAGFKVSAAISISWGELPWFGEILEKTASLFESHGADEITLQDPYGLLTPPVTKELVGNLTNKNRLPVNLHLHDVNLLGVASLASGIGAGARGVDTTLSTLAWSYSPPQTESLVMALRGTHLDSGLDISLIEEAADWFERSKAKKGFKYKAVYSVDHYLLKGEMPIAIRRALADTLRDSGRGSLIEECWAELPAVWNELGRPPLISPMIQGICAQALENVVSGVSYGKLDYRVSAFLRGEFGQARKGANPNLVKKASLERTTRRSVPIDINTLSPDAYPSEDDRITYACFPALADKFFLQRSQARAKMPDTRFVGRDQKTETLSVMPRRLIIERHGEAEEVSLEGMGPLENGKRTLFLRIGGEAAKIEVTFPRDQSKPVYELLHHGKKHSFEFVEILHAGKNMLPVMIKEDGKEEEILYSFPRLK